MKWEEFLKPAERIVSDHRAQYVGEYVMKGGGILGTVEKYAGPLLDAVAAATGQEWAIPLTQALGGTISGVSQGESFGKALGQGAIGGAEALAGQEALGAFGIGQGNTMLNDSLGVNISPSVTGLPDVGGAIGNIFSGAGSTGATGSIPSGSMSVPSNGFTPLSGTGGGGSIGTGGGGVAGAGAIAPPGSLSGPVSTDFVSSAGAGAGGSDLTDLRSTLSSVNGFNQFMGANSGVPATTGPMSIPSNGFTPLSGAPSGGGGTENVTGSGSFLDTLKTNTAKSLSNPGAIAGAGGLIYDALNKDKPVTGEGALKTQASQLGQQGQQLSSYIQSGQLPPGLQQGINQASESAKATIRSQYASRGMSGSSAEQADLAAVDQRSQAQAAEYAMNLLNTGISEAGLSSQLYENLMKNALEQDQNLGTAIANFAGAAGGGSAGGKAIEVKV